MHVDLILNHTVLYLGDHSTNLISKNEVQYYYMSNVQQKGPKIVDISCITPFKKKFVVVTRQLILREIAKKISHILSFSKNFHFY